MKNTTRGILLVAIAALLAGCTMTEGEFNSVKTTLAGSPAVKRREIQDCIARRQVEPLSRRQMNAEIMNVSLSRYPSAFCNRLINALANGRISYADFKALDSDTADHSKFIRVMQGR